MQIGVGILFATLLLIYVDRCTRYNNENHDSLERVTVTVYNSECTQTDAKPLETASGFRINIEDIKSKKIRIIAVSRDLLDKYPYGSIVIISNKVINAKYGEVFVVLDTLNERYTKTIDILISDDEINKWENVPIVHFNEIYN